ncbi:unnamed protein product [Protopolystoma xenopodis]|uniref:DUF4704 domain-containing protein n=1 Tax=Protopolystoma xenopodis TaxID=117903 RepID=A0A3S5FDH2_9PLAT|nr:unnamed protein product [Protopolystoma xenopodis]
MLFFISFYPFFNRHFVSVILKTIVQLILQSQQNSELLLVRQTFLRHLTALCTRSPDNRRIILQMSVWQDWLLGLAPVYPQHGSDAACLADVVRLLCCLLQHALRREYGGWRVWIDTLAILHARASRELAGRRLSAAAAMATMTSDAGLVASRPACQALANGGRRGTVGFCHFEALFTPSRHRITQTG